jgi:hypothetical protein
MEESKVSKLKSKKKSLSRSRMQKKSEVNNTFTDVLSAELLPKTKFTSVRGGARTLNKVL